MNKEILKQAFEELEKMRFNPVPHEYGPYTACLMDEEDEQSPVQICDRNGIARLTMNQEDYFAIRNWKG